MADRKSVNQPGDSLSPEERQTLDRLLARIARNSDAIEQTLEYVERMAESGTLAAINAVFKDFDENFSAITRPEFMGMVANLMMVLGLFSEISYEPFFDAAMKVPGAVNAGYPQFQTRRARLGVREAVTILRSPEMASLLQLVFGVLQAQRSTVR